MANKKNVKSNTSNKPVKAAEDILTEEKKEKETVETQERADDNVNTADTTAEGDTQETHDTEEPVTGDGEIVDTEDDAKTESPEDEVKEDSVHDDEDDSDEKPVTDRKSIGYDYVYTWNGLAQG